MSGAEFGLALSVFLACAVEAVEALTIVLAVGTSRSWSSALSGVGVAAIALAAIVALLGPALTSLPINALRVVIGGLLLTFGLQWLRKAILRSAGLRAKHDELDAYQQEVAAARAAGMPAPGFDGYSFAIAFKGVLLEGLEVAFIVLTFGANQHRVGLAAVAAALAVLVVVLVGIVARAPLARVPENTIKFAVGVMLSSFGIFWGAEGAGADWPAGDAALPRDHPGCVDRGARDRLDRRTNRASSIARASIHRRSTNRADRRGSAQQAGTGLHPGGVGVRRRRRLAHGPRRRARARADRVACDRRSASLVGDAWRHACAAVAVDPQGSRRRGRLTLTGVVVGDRSHELAC